MLTSVDLKELIYLLMSGDVVKGEQLSRGTQVTEAIWLEAMW
jgi:hypothetical protein